MSNDTMPCGCHGHADNAGMCRYPGLESTIAAERKRRESLEDELHRERLAHTAAVTRAEQAERELARVQGLPELEWAQTSAVIAQGLALHARTDQTAAKRMMEALDKAKTYVERLEARAEQAEQGRDEKADMLETALSQRRAAEQDRDDALAATARAEADNAALHSALGAALTILHARGLQEHTHSMTVTYEDDHPGAALLERMRALENEVRLSLNASHARHDYSYPRVEACSDARCVRLRGLLEKAP